MPRFDSRPSSAVVPRPADGAFDPITSTDAARRELGALAAEEGAGEAHHRLRPKSAATLVSSMSGASLPGWPLQEDEMRLSRKSDRAARWPPTPSSLQRPLSATTTLGGFGSTAELKPDVSTAIAGRVDPFIRARKSGGPLHSGAGPDIQQAYENHGPLAPTPFTYGFLPESKLPPPPPPPPPIELLAEPVAPTATGARGGRRTKKDEEAEKAAAEMQRMLASRLPPSEPKPKPLRVVYAHVRGKCIPVPVGGGKQFVYWLGAAACTRYLTSAQSYLSPFSQELTSHRVLARLRVRPSPPPKTLPGAADGRPGSRGSSAGLSPSFKKGSSAASTTAFGRSTSPSKGGKDDPAAAEREAALAQLKRFEEWQEQQRAIAAELGTGDAGVDDDGLHYWHYLSNEARLSESGLRDGDHVWVDVGDGRFLSEVRSTTAAIIPRGVDRDERPGVPLMALEVSGYNPVPNPAAITGEQCLLNRDDRVPDALPTVAYYQVRRAIPPPPYHDWQEVQERRKRRALAPPPPPPPPPREEGEGEEGAPAPAPAAAEGDEDENGEQKAATDAKAMAAKAEPEEEPDDPSIWTHDMSYDDFHACFQDVNLGDMTGNKSWGAEVQGVLWRFWDLVCYIFYCHGGPAAAAEMRAAGGASTDARDHELMSLSIFEFRALVRKACLTSPYLNLAQMDLMVPNNDGKRRSSHVAVHHPEGRVFLPEFIETLVRVSIARQANVAEPAVKLPTALIDLVEQHFMPAYDAFPKQEASTIPSMLSLYPGLEEEEEEAREPGIGPYKVLPQDELDGAIGRVLRIHAPTSRALFSKYAVKDNTHSVIDVREFVGMCRAANLLAPSPSDARSQLTPDDLVELYSYVLLSGEAPTAAEEWGKKYLPGGLDAVPPPPADAGAQPAASAGPTSSATRGGSGTSITASLAAANKSVAGCMLLSEFEELLCRLALRKFKYDTLTTDARKVHEIFQLLRVSLASGARRRPGSVSPGYLLGGFMPGGGGRPPAPAPKDGVYASHLDPFEPRLMITNSQQVFEAKANAERGRAVDMLLNKAKYDAMAAAKEAKGGKGDKKGGDKKGGKKKK